MRALWVGFKALLAWLYAVVVGASGILLFYYLFGDAPDRPFGVLWVFAAFGFGGLLVFFTTAGLMLGFRFMAPAAHREFYLRNLRRR
jgi:hypothetical protein